MDQRFARLGAGVLAALTAATISSCTLNAGTAFAEQYEQFLSTQPEVASYTVRGHNDLPANGSADTSVTLHDGLSDETVAATIDRLAAHVPEQKIHRHGLTVSFSATNAEQAPATVALNTRIDDGRPVSDDDTLRRVQGVREFAAVTPGLTEQSAAAGEVRAQGSADPFETARHVADYLATDPTGVMRATAQNVDEAANRRAYVAFDKGDDIQQLQPMRQLLAALPAGVVPSRWLASSAKPYTSPFFEIVVPRDTDPTAVRGVEDRAAQLGVPVKAYVAE